MKTYSISGITLRRDLLPERTHRQTTLVVRAKSKAEALRLMGAALDRAKLTETDWQHSGQIDVPKFAEIAMYVLPGVVLYESGRERSDEWMILHPRSAADSA